MFTNFHCKAGFTKKSGYAKILLAVSYWANANVKDNVKLVLIGHYRHCIAPKRLIL